MKLVLRNKKKLTEIKKGKWGDVFVTMSPRTFLKLTLPKQDYDLVERFLNEAKNLKNPQDAMDLSRKLGNETDPEVMEIGKNVIQRGALYFARKGSYDPTEEDRRLSLAIKLKDQPVVTSHGGRARSVIAALSGVPEIDASIMFYDMTVEQFLNDPSYEYIQSQDFGGDPTSQVSREEIKVIDSETDKKPTEKPSEDVGDILEIGDKPAVFETEIIPKGHVYPNGRVNPSDYKIKDGEKKARFVINEIYTKMYKILRKTRGWGDGDISHHNEVADAADSVIDNNYIVSDEKGILYPKMKRGSFYHMDFDRPTVGTITIKRK
jgi:hypothetical protein